jgi:hypothetical protein
LSRMLLQTTNSTSTRPRLTVLARKKAEKEEEVKKLETEKMALEKIMRDKEENYAKQKGGKYMKRDDFRQYAANLRTMQNRREEST